jgi:chromosome segregation ATPase
MKHKQYKQITDKNINDIEARLKESRKQSRILQTKVNNRELEINGLKDYIHRLEHLVNKIEHEQHKERQLNKRRSERAKS